MTEKPCFIYITTPSLELAQQMASQLLEKKLIACANILPQMHSIYSWKGQIHKDHECVLLLKTQEHLFKEIEKVVITLHSYECPCLLKIPITGGHHPYLEWLHNQVLSGSAPSE